VEKFQTLLLLLILITPIAKGGYSLVFVVSALIFLIYVGYRAKQLKNKYILALLAFVCFWSLISISITVNTLESMWDLREYIRVPLSIITLFYFSRHKCFTVSKLVAFLALVIFIDFLFLFIFKDLEFSKLLLRTFAMSGMSDYLDGYWRHIGIGGNPNFSAFIYSIFIIIGVHTLREDNVIDRLGIIRKSFIITALPISFFLLVLTFSRSGIIALVFSLSFFFIKPKYFFYLFSLCITIFLIQLYSPNFELFIKFTNRFSSFSSAEARADHWVQLFNNYDLVKFVFGSKFETSVIDNDYLYFFYRFGLVLGGLLLFLPIYPLFKIKSKSNKRLYLNLIVFYYVAAIPGGPLSDPKTYFFLSLLGTSFVTVQPYRVKYP
jgi:hypothetical protein